ncbi:MAG: NlpC/P60 family protein [Oscillospiraceae bacterium]
MREVKEKSPLKERTVKTLKSAPQAAFRRGTDASFEQLRQELREAAQDGKSDDRYESGNITDTADHAVQEARHLAEKAVHKLSKTKSESEARTKSVPQHERPQPQHSTTAPKEYPPASARPSHPPQSQPQVSRPVREVASPIREKPVPPANAQQPKTRAYTPDAKAPAPPSQYPTPRIHENAKAVSAGTMPSTMEHSVRKSVSPIKEKPVPPANAPQPKMREHAPDAKAPVSSSQHATLRIHEKTQNVSAEITPTPTGSAEKHTAAPFEQSAHHLQMERSAHEQAFPIKEKPVPPANTPQPKMREHTPTADAPVHLPQHPASQIYERPQNVYQLQTNRSVRELETSVREKPSASSLREIPAALKTDTTQFALPEIKTKEYIRKKRKKQHLLKEEASGIEDMLTDSETFSPVIRTRETVREQQKLHVSHSAEQEQPVMPQIRTRQPQTASMPADIEPTKPEVPQPPLPDIKSKQKYIAAQQPTQVTPVQANPQQAAREMIRGDIKLCKPLFANETATLPTGKNAAPAKPVRVQKQVRPAVVRKQKIKTAPKAKIKSATPAAKALPNKASSAAPKQAATVIRKGQVLRDTAIKTAKVAKEAGKKVLRAIAAAAEKLVAAIGAGGAAAVSVVVVILLVGMLFASPLGILFAGEDTGTEIKIPDAVATLNGEFTDEIYRIMEDHPYDELDMQEGMEAAMLQNWRNVLAVYAVKVSTDEEHGLDVMTMDEEKLQLLREFFFDANKLKYELTTRTVDGEQITTLHISAQIKDAMQMADEYGFTAQQREMLEELLKPDYDDIFLSLIGNYQPDGTPIGPVDISDIQGTLPDDLDPLRESIVLTAYQLLGKVTYFWGGKSLVLGWDSRWGTPTTVTAPGSGSTGKVLPFGLDCSGFVDWTFYNATSGAYLPGRGGGAASQHGYCTNIAWADALPGDLVFYADDSHVGIVCGYDSVGNLLVIHCSGGQNGVVVTGREGFAVAARPDLFTD